MKDLMMKARGQSLKDLVSTMEEDDAKSIPTLMLKITAGPEGIEIEKTGGEGEVESDEQETEGMETENESETEGEGMPTATEVETPEEDKAEGGEMNEPASHLPHAGPDAMFEMLIAKKKKKPEEMGE